MSLFNLDELKQWDEKVCEIGKKRNMDWYPIDYELLDYYSMISAMAYHGLPTHYDHWSFGKTFERTHQMYNLGAEGLPYEMIINSDPSIAYLMRENPLYMQILIMAHCVGHSDFFKMNRMFKHTRAETAVQRFRAAKKRIQSYTEDQNIGVEEVEKVLDACHAIQFQTNRFGQKRKSRAEMISEYTSLINQDKDGRYKHINLSKHPIEPDYDLLAFIAENARLPDWKIDIINIVRDESQYFFPQIQTKIANEGWASFTHYHICHELDLPADMHFAMLKTHNQVVRPHIGGINPYHLGFHLFQKILERHGYEECLIARESLNDASFIGQYLTEEDCYELNLFSYSKKFNGATFIDDISDKDGWKLVKKELIANVAGASIPVVAVSELKSDGTLILRHEHDGRDLELSYARKVGEHIRYLWNSPVHFITKVDGESSRFEL